MVNLSAKDKADMIVMDELAELRKLVASSDKCQIDFDGEDDPILNVRADDGHYLDLAVRKVRLNNEWVNFNVYLSTEDYREDEPNTPNNYWVGEGSFHDFVPGDISVIMEHANKAITTDKAITTVEPVYHFTDEQMAAIRHFNDAMRGLGKNGVFLLVEKENREFRFANSLEGCFFDGSDGYMETGMCEMVAEIDVGRLPKSDMQYDSDFFIGDGLDLVKEK